MCINLHLYFGTVPKSNFMKKNIVFLFYLLVTLLAVQCAAPADAVSVTQADGVDFKKFRTIGFRSDGGDKVNNLSQFDNEILRERMHRALELEFQKRRLSMADSTSGDLVAQLVVTNKGQVQSQTTYNNNGGFNDPYFRNRGTNTTTSTTTPTFVNRHQIIVNVYEQRTKRLLWSGSLVRNYRNPDEVQRGINGEVAEIMARYPVKGKD
jgi:Domain of unknown function (DUF4136)